MLYDEAGILDRGNGRLAVGREAIRAFYETLVSSGVRFEIPDQRPAIVSGDVALTSTRLSDGTITAEVAKRQTDGSWLWVIDQPTVKSRGSGSHDSRTAAGS